MLVCKKCNICVWNDDDINESCLHIKKYFSFEKCNTCSLKRIKLDFKGKSYTLKYLYKWAFLNNKFESDSIYVVDIPRRQVDDFFPTTIIYIEKVVDNLVYFSLSAVTYEEFRLFWWENYTFSLKTHRLVTLGICDKPNIFIVPEFMDSSNVVAGSVITDRDKDDSGDDE